MQLTLDGKTVFDPQVIVKLDGKAQVSQKQDNSNVEYFIEVSPSLQNVQDPDLILMKFKIGQNRDGQFKWLSMPQIIAHSNLSAEMEVKSEQGEYKTIALKVTPSLF